MDEKKHRVLLKSGTLNQHPEKVVDNKFLEDQFFDPNDLLQVKYEMIRKVETENASVTTAASEFGFSRPSFYRLQQKFNKEGLVGLISEKKGPKQSHKITNEIMIFVLKEIEEDKTLKARALKKLIENKFGISLHIRSIERALEKEKKRNL